MTLSDITQSELLSRLHYDPKTGIFTRIKSKVNRVGKPAGSVHRGHGYVVIKIRSTAYLAHRLAWLYVYGAWPTQHIDHKNGTRTDNRIENLRLADPVQNCANRTVHKTNKSGFKGVVMRPDCPLRPWAANIFKNGRQVHLGSFATPEEANAAYAAAAAEIHGEYSRAA